MYKWLTSLPDSVDKVIIYSDTCGGQNRNRHIAAVLLYAAQITKLMTIHQKFLERGHTYMEVDSMPSAIVFAKRNVPVHSPHEWQNVFRAARFIPIHCYMLLVIILHLPLRCIISC